MTGDDIQALANAIAEKLEAVNNRPTLRQLAAGVEGWICPRCGCERWWVSDTRFDGGVIRKRECRNCHKLIKTIEQPIEDA